MTIQVIALFALIFNMFSLITAATEIKTSLFNVKENHRRTQGVFKSSEAKTQISCGLVCLRNTRCVATNFRNTESGNGVCELLDFSPSELSFGLEYNEDWVFAHNLKDDCRFEPCSNGGACVYNMQNKQFTCYCTSLWKGHRCQILQEKAAIFNFTTLGSRGRKGPTDNREYKGTVLENTDVSSGTQIWSVPVTGNYHVIACGAAGADGIGKLKLKGGKGALVNGTVFLERGNVLKILVGQQGQTPSANAVGGGGGGTFVFNSVRSKMLAIAGGGGGGGKDDDGGPGRAIKWDIGIGGKVCAKGGVPTSGGGGGSNYDGTCFKKNQCTNVVCDQGGKSFKNGGEGGKSTSIHQNCDGGFGGGGACSDAPGGGGGFSGGWVWYTNNGTITFRSEGGYSTAPPNWERTTGYNDGNGYVIIKLLY